jgi:hypothetical protein
VAVIVFGGGNWRMPQVTEKLITDVVSSAPRHEWGLKSQL